MQQHLGRLEGVAKVDVSLAQGTVIIVAKEDSRLDPAKVFKATYDSGVSVVELTIEATGWLERDAKNVLLLRISADQVFPVIENDLVKSIGESPPSQKVFLRARVFRRAGKEKPKMLGSVRLEVLEVRKLQ